MIGGPRVLASATLCLLAATPAVAQVTVTTSEAAFRAALPMPTVINFDDLPTSGTVTGSEYASMGLTITHLANRELNVLSSPPVAGNGYESVFASLPNAISSSYASTPKEGYSQACCGIYFDDTNSDDIRFAFTTGASAAGVHFAENDARGVTVRILDLDGNELSRQYLPPFAPHTGFLGVSSTTPIGALEVLNAGNDADGMLFDDLVFQPVCLISPPVIAGSSVSKSLLWPPDHQLVRLQVNYAVTASCGVSSASSISVISNEPDNGLGDGDTPGDIQIMDGHSVWLRAERSGTGNGRRYTLQIRAEDAEGNVSTQELTVAVPKSVKYR